MRFNVEEVMLGLQAAVERELPEAMHKAAERVAAEARESHPYHDRSGTLTSQIKPGAVTVDGDTIFVEVRADRSLEEAPSNDPAAHPLDEITGGVNLPPDAPQPSDPYTADTRP